MSNENVVPITAPDKGTLLKNLLSEYGNSLTRVDGEKAHQSAIAARGEKECSVLSQHFKKLARAQHKDQMRLTREDLEAQIDLFDRVLGDKP